MISLETLESYVGRPIEQICPFGYKTDNHCAHFVSHVLQLGIGLTCSGGSMGAAGVRVHELFPYCGDRREIRECPTTGEGLIFVSERSNFHGSPSVIDNVPKKHVGILWNGRVWHYSNTKHKVIVQTVADFLDHYPKQNNALWYGALPAAARPTSIGTSS